MKKIVLLTGGGDLPLEVIRKLIKKKTTFFCLICCRTVFADNFPPGFAVVAQF